MALRGLVLARFKRQRFYGEADRCPRRKRVRIYASVCSEGTNALPMPYGAKKPCPAIISAEVICPSGCRAKNLSSPFGKNIPISFFQK
jgi:hypothetical protein